jgi:flagellin
MGLSVVNNVSSLTAQNNMNRTSGALAKSLERLSSGLKVNRGADGPASLVISEQQRAQIAGLRAAMDNTNKAVALVQTGEGALNEINRLLGKVRTLALDSANLGVNDTNALAANQAEIGNALTTITNIANTTQFGTKKLLDGSRALSSTDTNAKATVKLSGTLASGNYAVTVDTAADRAKAAVPGTALVDGDLTGNDTEVLTINGVDISFVHTSGSAATTLTDAAAAVNAAKDKTGVEASVVSGKLQLYSTNFGSNTTFTASVKSISGANKSALTAAVGSNQSVAVTDGVDIEGKINGVTVTGVGNTLSMSGMRVTFDASAADITKSDATATTVTVSDANVLQFQIGANAGQTASVGMDSMRSADLGSGVSGRVADLSKIDVNKLAIDRTLSSDIVKVIDSAIGEVSTLRGTLGAFQANTLESNANNLRATMENTVAAESVVRDTDFAEEMAMFTKNQVMMQAGQTVLGNANQLPQMVAALLRG